MALIFAFWFWKTRMLTYIDEYKHFFCLLAYVGLTDFSQKNFVTPRGSTLHQKIPPPSYFNA